MELIFITIIVALAFEFINGFHDTALAIATSVSTKVLTPRQAVVLAAVCNGAGALAGVSVAKTIGQGLVDTSHVTTTIFCALFAAIIWNLATWWLGLPSSSSHALIGGLCGATLASAHGNWAVIRWAQADGIWQKVIKPMFCAPVLGAIGGFLLMILLIMLLHRLRPRIINQVFGRLQLVSAAWMGFSHGVNDAQKTMGVITLLLVTGTTTGAFDHLPASLLFLRTPEFQVATWVKVACAITLAAGTATGGVAHHPHARTQGCAPPADPRLRGPNHGRWHHSLGLALGHPSVHHAGDLRRDRRRGFHQALQRRQVGHGR